MVLLRKSQFDAAQILLAGGFCGSALKAADGDAALHAALRSETSRPPAVLLQALLADGADAGALGAHGDSPLMLAVARHGGDTALVQLLLSHLGVPAAGAAAAAANGAGNSALSVAASAALAGAATAAAATADSCRPAGSLLSDVDMLSVLLAAQPPLPLPLGKTMLQSGLIGALPDAVTALVVRLMPAEDVDAAISAAAKAGKENLLPYDILVARGLFHTAVACLLGSSPPGQPLVKLLAVKS